MTDDGRGLFDDEPPIVPKARADHDHIDPDEVQPRSAGIADDAALVDPPHAAAGEGRADDDEGRPVALRLAGLHLRMGSLALARAELESLAGRGMLDEDALLDLAEVRWRTGDLAGAGEAANALLARERTDALALVIAAEAVAAAGRPGEARRLAARALEQADGPLDPLFAGIPRSLVWPGEDADEVPAGADSGGPLARVPAPGGATAPPTPPACGSDRTTSRNSARPASLPPGVRYRKSSASTWSSAEMSRVLIASIMRASSDAIST